ncbi:MAG: murein biosynthesis integral membrane protein MurJ [Candidatus Magasanikbacteria bacterium]|nr:murein biosynthesis integral membrane protein MurJ [Candidatus Magasanikbacteria bacterium]
MITQLFSSQSKTITGAAIILGAASFLSRIIGVLRDRILAHYFGAGDILDAYYAAFRIPDFVFNLLIAGALSAGFIPVFLEIWQKDKDRAWKLTNNILTIVSLGFLCVCAVLYALTPILMGKMVNNFPPEKLELTIRLTRIMFLSPVLLGLSSVISSVLHSFKNFIVFALSPILYNLGIILGVLFFVPRLGPAGLAWGVVLGAILHVSIQIPALFHYGFCLKPIFSLKDPLVRKVGKLIVPRTLGLATQQINLLIMTVLASSLAAGSIAIFNLANNLQFFSVGIIGHSFAIAAFPTLAKLMAEGQRDEMISQLSFSLRQIIFFIVPATIIFLLLRAQIVRVVLGSGKFDWNSTIATADTLAFFSLSLFAQCLILILARAFYALQDTWTPFLLSAAGVILNFMLSLSLRDHFGVAGLALAFSISGAIQLALTWIALRFKLKTLHERSMLKSLLKISLAAFMMATMVQYMKTPLAALVDMTRFWGIFIQGAVSALIGLFTYILICHWLKLEELELIKKSLRKRWLKLAGTDTSLEQTK